MKDKILFINACVRPESRTMKLSRHLLNRLDGEITEIDLYKEELLPLYNEGLKKELCMMFQVRNLSMPSSFQKRIA